MDRCRKKRIRQYPAYMMTIHKKIFIKYLNTPFPEYVVIVVINLVLTSTLYIVRIHQYIPQRQHQKIIWNDHTNKGCAVVR